MISLTNSQIGELMGQFLLAGTGTLSFAILCAGGCHGLVRV